MLRGSRKNKRVSIAVYNGLERDISVHHAAARTSHLISRNTSVDLAIGGEGDYLHISLVSGQGALVTGSLLEWPSFMDFKLALPGEIDLVHRGERMKVALPKGTDTMQLRLNVPPELSAEKATGRWEVVVKDA
ncbi:MAG: hypothetical protein GY765_14625 [bacterium]|nr:hypothetical protein [bacterium]